MRIYEQKEIKIEKLKAHKKNYREHPEDQIEHIIASIEQHGFYRNIVVAKDNTILAGHGVVLAAKKMNLEKVPAIILDVDSNSSTALKVLAGDNEISHLGLVNDRMLTDVLKEILEVDDNGLFGTGYDESMLNNLLFVIRPPDQIQNNKNDDEWIGMPDFDEIKTIESKVTISFKDETDRESFFRFIGMEEYKNKKTITWPMDVKDDVKSILFTEK